MKGEDLLKNLLLLCTQKILANSDCFKKCVANVQKTTLCTVLGLVDLLRVGDTVLADKLRGYLINTSKLRIACLFRTK